MEHLTNQDILFIHNLIGAFFILGFLSLAIGFIWGFIALVIWINKRTNPWIDEKGKTDGS